jgi:hypothetical protein
MEKNTAENSDPMHMSQTLKAELLSRLQARYARRSCDGKSRMLDELCEDHGYERMCVIKLLRDEGTSANVRSLRRNAKRAAPACARTARTQNNPTLHRHEPRRGTLPRFFNRARAPRFCPSPGGNLPA